MDNSEKYFVSKCLEIFSKYFICQTEVYSKCQKGRIDILLSTTEGERFGIEAKLPDRKTGAEIADYVKQAIRYTRYEFEVERGVYERIPIFICPSISYRYFLMNEKTKVIDGEYWHKDRHEEYNEHHSFNGFIGGLGVGEVRSVSKEDFIFSTNNKIIFDSRVKWIYENNTRVGKAVRGVHKKNYEYLLKKQVL